MEFSHCFLKGSVVKKLISREKYQAIHELIQRVPIFAEIHNLNEFEEAVFQREKLQTTSMGKGVAVAHGRIKNFGKVITALGVSTEGIDFDAIDGKPVHFLFIIATDINNRDEYLKVLASIIRSIRDESMRRAILSSCARNTSQNEIENAIREAFFNSLNTLSANRKATVA